VRLPFARGRSRALSLFRPLASILNTKWLVTAAHCVNGYVQVHEILVFTIVFALDRIRKVCWPNLACTIVIAGDPGEKRGQSRKLLLYVLLQFFQISVPLLTYRSLRRRIEKLRHHPLVPTQKSTSLLFSV
jgi:hypothetical protein